MKTVFIDGSAGTTGLRIRERLALRNDISLLVLPEELRKDTAARKEALNAADIAFLCLPDAAAMEAVSLIDNESTAVIDTSTAHRTNPSWVYGMPELAGKREQIAASKRIANPGCHASGFIALVAPLVAAGVLSADVALAAFSITGYSGGGKNMIAAYGDPSRDLLLGAPRQYGLSQSHKHLPEMQALCGLDTAPLFSPVVADYYAGMEVTVPLFATDVKGGIDAIRAVYRAVYGTGMVRFAESDEESGFLSAAAFAGRDDMEVRVQGNDARILLISRFDNLGKGASGAAIQNMNILLGVPENTGLVTGE